MLKMFRRQRRRQQAAALAKLDERMEATFTIGGDGKAMIHRALLGSVAVALGECYSNGAKVDPEVVKSLGKWGIG